MHKVSKLLTISTLSLTLLGSTSFAQDHHDDRRQDHHDQDHHDDHQDQGNRYVHHSDWRRGHRMDHNDWSRGQRVDYRQYHLSAPRRGYEWRQVDGNYVLAAVATGLISSVIIASANR